MVSLPCPKISSPTEVDNLKVLFKRKPVQYLSQPPIEDGNAEVWLIPQTGEVFAKYEAYLQRMDFYKQRRFICEITGHSSLTFFEALKSEMEGSKDVERAFPDALREPVLRKVQFSTISRIDSLVDHIFDEFKLDFYPGEAVTVTINGGERLQGIVREKAKFPLLLREDGSIERHAFSRYFVALKNRPEEEALVDDAHIFRDRKAFTKQMLRSFIKNTVSRETWNGAPWLVKDNIAARFKIDTEVPPHLQYDNKVAEKKAQQAQKKNEHDGNIMSFLQAQQRLPELKPNLKSHKSKHFQQQLARNKQQQFLEYQQALAQHEGFQQSPSTATLNGQHQFILANFPKTPPLAVKAQAPAIPKPAPPPPIKYPIEDLDITPIRDGTHRPALKFLTKPKPTVNGTSKKKEKGLRMESVGALIETWETLNVYCEVFLLDSFTFDDYLEAVLIASDEVQCELFIEIHCAILKLLVEPIADGGKILVNLPEMPEDDESDEEEQEEEDEKLPTPSPEPEVKPVGRATRSSLAKSDAAQLKAEQEQQRPASVDARKHRAVEMLAEYAWVDRLRARDFLNGGWEIIIVGLLYQLSLSPRFTDTCDEILERLAPLDEEATQEVARQQYAQLDVNLRLKVLQIICMLTIETKAMRGYMEECSEQMTVHRKEKIEWQRTRKTTVEELRALEEERRALIPEEPAQEPAPELAADQDGDIKMADADEDGDGDGMSVEDSEDDGPRTARSLRRGGDRAADRKRKREEEQEKREKAEAAAKIPKISPQLKKVMKEIEKKKDKIKECEEEIATLDNDLREADCPRARCLGRDRFWNRYWWFEKNGMPYAGLPDSSTADAGYANGCIWVQGPDQHEREGFIELPEDEEQKYRKAHQMTVIERKKLEEGPTGVATAHEWGYYDEPDSVDMLIGWLDGRGQRELKLRKEMQLQREKISLYMQKRRDHLAEIAEKNEAQEINGRMTTRTKISVENEPHHCLEWRNTTAINEIGHLHSEPPRQKRKTKKGVAVERETRNGPVNRQGKPVGRQGSRYHF